MDECYILVSFIPDVNRRWARKPHKLFRSSLGFSKWLELHKLVRTDRFGSPVWVYEDWYDCPRIGYDVDYMTLEDVVDEPLEG